MTRTQEFIKGYSNKLEGASAYFNFDCALQSREDFHKAKFKFLLILPTPVNAKAVSSTAAVISDFFQTHRPDIFMDVAWLPSEKDIKLYDTLQLPYAIGTTTHLDPSHFDCVGFSISILHEMLTIPTIISSFKYCDKPIPLTWTERKDLVVGTCPPLIAGGITSQFSDLLFGELGDGRQAYIDCLCLGTEEPLADVFDNLMLCQKEGKTIQDAINLSFSNPAIYQPQAYEVIYKDSVIVSNKKINPLAQDQVIPHYVPLVDKRLYSARTVVAGSGENAGVLQWFHSEGCCANGNCAFCLEETSLVLTDKGYKQISELKVGDFLISSSGKSNVTEIFPTGTKRILQFNTKKNYKLRTSDTHKVFVWENDTITYKSASELKIGDYLILKRDSQSFGDYHEDWAEVVGRLMGDGYFNYNAASHTKNCYLACSDSEKAWEEALLNRLKIPYKYSLHERNVHRYSLGASAWDRLKLEPYSQEGKPIPKVLYSYDKESMCSMLRGWFDTDGTVTKNGDISITSKHETHVRFIQEQLLNLGILSTIDFYRRQVKEGKYGFKERVRDSYRVRIYDVSSKRKFIEQIGFSIEHKRLRSLNCTGTSNITIPMSVELRQAISKNKPNLSYINHLGKNGKLRGVTESVARTYSGSADLNYLLYNNLIVQEITDITDGGVAECYDLNLDSVMKDFVTSGVLVHNCAEAWYCGPWRENSIENILWAIREGRKYCAARSCKPLSFNSNHHSSFKEILYEARKRYPQVKFNNMRLNEMAHDYDQWLMMSFLGQSHFAAPIEGISDRIRNGVMNKNLDKSSVDFMFDQLIGQSVSDIKVGVVWTGLEEDEDWEELYETFDRINEKAKAYNKKYPARLKMCLTKEALTPVPGVGLVPQDELQPGLVEGLYPTSIIATQPQGFTEICRVELSDGTILRGTPHHPVLTRFCNKGRDVEWTELQNLKVGQRVMKRCGTEAYGVEYQTFHLEGSRQEDAKDLVLNEELAAVLGWYMGDGYLGRQDNFNCFGLCFNKDEYEVYSKLEETLSKLGYNANSHDLKHSENLIGFRLWNSSFGRAILREFGHTSHAKKIPGIILKSPKSVQIEFLKHWFGSDGTVTTENDEKKNSRIMLCSVNKQVLLTAKVMLDNMGIVSKVRAVNSWYKTESGEKVYKPSFNLEILMKSVKKFKELGLITDLKLDRITKVQNTCRFPDRYGTYETIVRSVEFELVEDEVFGVQTGNVTYVTDGVVSHNTGLVHYPNTPFYFTQRVIAKKAFNKERFLTNERYAENLSHNIHVKFNGFIGSTFLEQAMIDLGRSLTPWVQKNIVEPNHVVYFLNSVIKDKAFDEVKAMIHPNFWLEKDPDHSISPTHRIRIELMGALINTAREKIKNIHTHDHSTTGKCLYTYKGCKTTCAATSMRINPYKEMGDCEIHYEQGLPVRTGQVLRELSGCDSCKTAEERKTEHLKRPIFNDKYSVEDLKAQYLSANFTKFRLVLNRKGGGFKELNPANTAYHAVAALLRASDKLLDNYWEITDMSNGRQTYAEMPYNAAGRQIVDVTFKENMLSEIQNSIAKANLDLKTVQILGVSKISMEDTLKSEDLILYRFETRIPVTNLQMDCKSWNKEIQVLKMDVYENVIDPTLTTPILAAKDGMTVGYFTLKARYNPNIYLSCLSNTKTIGKSETRSVFNLTVLDVVRESSLTCRCGSYALVSLSNNTTYTCKECLIKQLLMKELK